jgi:cytochrome c peroxidase
MGLAAVTELSDRVGEAMTTQRPRASAAVYFCAACWLATQTASAAPPKVPKLPTVPFGYVKYAITDLPDQYKTPDVQATNNTPADNPLTDAGATLGRVLFYDKQLSHTNSVACASCHRQANGFSDPNQFSAGVNGLTGRHSMGLANAGYYEDGKAFWDERASSLEDQALIPIQNSVEMGSTLPEVVGKLSATNYYPQLFQAAFGSPTITPDRIAKAIGQFERSMVSYKSKFDSAYAANPGGPPNFAAVFTTEELQGEEVFHSDRGRCSQCHSTAAQVSDAVHNIGLNADDTSDPGAGDGKFKAPSLRNVAVRGKFMHDGRFSNLHQVVQFYETGIIHDNPNVDPLLDPNSGFLVTLEDFDALIAFLNTLTDTSFLTDAKFSDPFVTLPGDYNGDGVVGPDDYNVWKNNLNDTTSLAADGNGDGIVNGADYAIWRDNFGATWTGLQFGSGGLSQTIPEPGSIVLMLIGAAGIAMLRVRARWRGRR